MTGSAMDGRADGTAMEGSPHRHLRVLCVEDSRMFGDLLAAALDREPDIEVVGRAEDVPGALAVLRDREVDVVVMDCRLPVVDGVEGVRQVKQTYPGTRVVLLTGSPTLELVVRAVTSGADGFLARDSSLGDVVAAVRAAHGIEIGEGTLEALRLRVRAEGNVDGRSWDPHLTDRERDVLALLAEALDPQTIAKHLGITVQTSRSYVRNVLTKLGAHSQLEAVIVAARGGLVTGLCCCERELDARTNLLAG